MVFSRIPLTRVPSTNRTISCIFFLQLPPVIPISKTQRKPMSQIARNFNKMNATCCNYTQEDYPAAPKVPAASQMDDPIHLGRFNHDCAGDLRVNASGFERKRPQPFDYFLVLDLEGKVEILEFPVLLIDVETMRAVDLFHRFVRPSAMSEQRINEYIVNKYGKFGVDRVWHDTAVPFNEVVQQFETWLSQHHLWEKKHDGSLNRAAFVTCPCFPGISGNWDVQTKVPQQCKVSRIKIPPYFMEWINLKDVYKNFYNPAKEARGMRTMMDQLQIPMLGSHHLGIDDTKNIARVLLRMLADGAVIPITARRNPGVDQNVSFLYKNRVR